MIVSKKESREKVCCLFVRCWCAVTRTLDTIRYIYGSILFGAFVCYFHIHTVPCALFLDNLLHIHAPHIVRFSRLRLSVFSHFLRVHKHFATWKNVRYISTTIHTLSFSRYRRDLSLFHTFFAPFLIVWISISENQIDALKWSVWLDHWLDSWVCIFLCLSALCCECVCKS